MLRYAITDRALYSGSALNPLDALVQEAGRWARKGIDFIQVREKDLEAGDLAELVRRVIGAVRDVGGKSRVLVNSRVDVAVAAGADGVHLTGTAGELWPEQVREVYRRTGLQAPVVSVSCHRLEEVARASAHGVDGILFGPVFGKVVDGMEVVPGVGMDELRAACGVAAGVAVFALGGVTAETTAECIAAGAGGVAGIRLFRD